MDMSLTLDHQQMLLKFIDESRLQKVTTIRNFARLIGLLVAVMPVFPIGRFHYRVLEKQKLMYLRKYKFKWSHIMPLTDKCKLTMCWWLNTIKTNIPNSFRPMKIKQTAVKLVGELV